MRLHVSFGCYDYDKTTLLRLSIHFSIIQVLFADHMYRLSRQQILVPQFSELMQAGTYFVETRRMLLFHALLI